MRGPGSAQRSRTAAARDGGRAGSPGPGRAGPAPASPESARLGSATPPYPHHTMGVRGVTHVPVTSRSCPGHVQPRGARRDRPNCVQTAPLTAASAGDPIDSARPGPGLRSVRPGPRTGPAREPARGPARITGGRRWGRRGGRGRGGGHGRWRRRGRRARRRAPATRPWRPGTPRRTG